MNPENGILRGADKIILACQFGPVFFLVFTFCNKCVRYFLVCVLLWFIGEHLTRTDYKTLSWHVTFLQKEILTHFLISFTVLFQCDVYNSQCDKANYFSFN